MGEGGKDGGVRSGEGGDSGKDGVGGDGYGFYMGGMRRRVGIGERTVDGLGIWVGWERCGGGDVGLRDVIEVKA